LKKHCIIKKLIILQQIHFLFPVKISLSQLKFGKSISDDNYYISSAVSRSSSFVGKLLMP